MGGTLPEARPASRRRTAFRRSTTSRLLHHERQVQGGMGRGDDDAVGRPEGRGIERHGGEVVAGQRRDVRVVVADVGTLGPQQLQQLERGALAQVGHVSLVGHAQEQDASAAHGLATRVQRPRDAGDGVVGHVDVDSPGQLDELAVEVEGARPPGQVEGIDRDTVAAQAGPGPEGHEAEGLGGRCFDGLPDVDAHAVGEDGHLVDEGDVHGPEGVLDDLGHLGRLG